MSNESSDTQIASVDNSSKQAVMIGCVIFTAIAVIVIFAGFITRDSAPASPLAVETIQNWTTVSSCKDHIRQPVRDAMADNVITRGEYKAIIEICNRVTYVDPMINLREFVK